MGGSASGLGRGEDSESLSGAKTAAECVADPSVRAVASGRVGERAGG